MLEVLRMRQFWLGTGHASSRIGMSGAKLDSNQKFDDAVLCTAYDHTQAGGVYPCVDC
jgi:hypothetical protein